MNVTPYVTDCPLVVGARARTSLPPAVGDPEGGVFVDPVGEVLSWKRNSWVKPGDAHQSTFFVEII